MIWQNILIGLGSLLIGYLLGSIPNGVVVGRLFFKKDPRDYGSHNSGGTNASRVLGKKAGWVVIVLDILKTCLAFWGVWGLLNLYVNKSGVELWDGGVFYLWLSVLGTSIGHCWSLFLGFKGGKTVAVYMGSLGGTSWLEFIFCAMSFFGVYFFKNKKVSLASLVSSGIILLATWIVILVCFLCHFDTSIFMWNFGNGGPVNVSICWEQGVMTTLIYLIMVIRHRQNIVRLKNGTEGSVDLFGK